jgi:hypothetical protein
VQGRLQDQAFPFIPRRNPVSLRMKGNQNLKQKMAGSSILPLHSPRPLETALLAQHHYAPNHEGIISSARERQMPPTQLNQRRKVQKLKPKPDSVTGWIEPPFFGQLQKHLGKANHDHCLFLCWEENGNDQHTIPVLIKDPQD